MRDADIEANRRESSQLPMLPREDYNILDKPDQRRYS